jgi:hypothetical protein
MSLIPKFEITIPVYVVLLATFAAGVLLQPQVEYIIGWIGVLWDAATWHLGDWGIGYFP